MLQTIVRVCQIAFLVLGSLALGWFLWGKLGGEKRRELPPFERRLAENVVEQVVRDLPRVEQIRRLLVMPVAGQELDGRITDMLVERIADEREEYHAIDARGYEGVLTPANVSEAISSAQKLLGDARPDGLLHANVRREFGHHGVGARVEMEVSIVTLDPKANFATQKVRGADGIESRASLKWFTPFMESRSGFWRIVIWIFLTAGLPFALFPVVQGITRRENNRLNALLLGSLVLFDVLAALALLGFRPGLFGWFLALLAAFAGFVYNFVICDRIDDMRK